jgi:hypothetical protein
MLPPKRVANQEKILIPVGRLYSGEEEEPSWTRRN